ncbi:EamA family transporter, partial [Staphylococcus aureus]|uniref:EamA family transporter n=1 Tax=Staphylococcus aureus TaxID=1280 RepID=UPI000A237025
SEPYTLTRSTIRIISIILNIYASDHTVLSEADSLMKLNPFWTILLSIDVLHEKVRKYQIAAMIIAILGMLLIVKPELSSSMIQSLDRLFSDIFAASEYT